MIGHFGTIEGSLGTIRVRLSVGLHCQNSEPTDKRKALLLTTRQLLQSQMLQHLGHFNLLFPNQIFVNMIKWLASNPYQFQILAKDISAKTLSELVLSQSTLQGTSARIMANVS